MSQPPTSFNVAGAVDLAALAQTRQIQEQATQARDELVARADAAGDVGPVAVDVTDATFQSEIIDRSATVPVVIDFWATWCQPCQQLSPILEDFASADGGAWVLAKVDVDANPQLSAAAQVQSIPTVMVVWQGKVIPGFQGALPKEQVRLFLDEVMALAAQLPGGAGPAATADPEVVAAENLMLAGDLTGAGDAYRQVLADRPGSLEAAAGLARVQLMERAQGLDAVAVRAAAGVDPSDVTAALQAADLDLLDGNLPVAFGRLVDAVRRTSGADRDRVRERLVDLFAIIGDDDPAVVAARRDLASALF